MHDDMACEFVCFEVSPLVPGAVGFRSQTFSRHLRTDHQAMIFHWSDCQLGFDTSFPFLKYWPRGGVKLLLRTEYAAYYLFVCCLSGFSRVLLCVWLIR